VRLLHDDLQELAETAGEHASLAKEVDQTAVIIDSVASSRNPFQLLIPIGRVHEGLAGAHCKVIAAFKKKEELAALLAVPQTAWTANTITDSEVLAAELEVVAREGIAFDLAEYYPAVYAVSAPVRDRSGSVVASVGLAAPAYAFEGEGRQWLADTLKTFAAKMSRKLGYSQGYSE
jgi:DNA-binding IclR family transcriptional regulator